MTPEQAAHETRSAIALWTSGFITDPATHAHGTELGFAPGDFYVAGRGGALGDVTADVVVAVFTFFAPQFVGPAWDRSAAVMARADAARAWAGCAHAWARRQQGGDWERLATLLGRVVANAESFGAPLFAAWRALPEPDDAPALAVHRMNALRELRAAMHAAATLTVGLTPREATSVLNPRLLRVLGWGDDAIDPAPFKERWQLAEARTDRMFGRHLAVLDDVERAELVELCKGRA